MTKIITVEEAQALIRENVIHLSEREINVIDSLGYYLAEPIMAPISIPTFSQSAMDGYAFNFDDKETNIEVVDEIAAGDTRVINLNKGQAVRIFTGAKVPEGVDTVVMQEYAQVSDNKLRVLDEGLKRGGNIRLKGCQIREGSVGLKKGIQITAAAIGFVSALGITKVKVYKLPKVAIIATGSELVKPGGQLDEGLVFESNTFMLKAALSKLKIEPEIIVVNDGREVTEKAIKQYLLTCDLILISGGISVGKYDFVKECLTNLNVKDVFYKVKQKPGKPLFFGKTKTCYVFALPGNPAAALTCFYQYVYPSIGLMMGGSDVYLSRLKLPITNQLVKKEGRSVFYRAATDFNRVSVLSGQGSDALQSFALANCFVYVGAETTVVNENDLVDVHLFP